MGTTRGWLSASIAVAAGPREMLRRHPLGTRCLSQQLRNIYGGSNLDRRQQPGFHVYATPSVYQRSLGLVRDARQSTAPLHELKESHASEHAVLVLLSLSVAIGIAQMEKALGRLVRLDQPAYLQLELDGLAYARSAEHHRDVATMQIGSGQLTCRAAETEMLRPIRVIVIGGRLRTLQS